MKLVAIINAWADTAELLDACLTNALTWADGAILAISDTSNTGEYAEWEVDFHKQQALFYVPDTSKSAQENELIKRNTAIRHAKSGEFTHFIMMDADEFYVKDQMWNERGRIQFDNLNGVVHPLKVYVGKPTLWCEDHTLVPGIQKLYPDTQLGNFKNYPFAYDAQGQAHIDPTRRTNQTKGIEMSPFYMHHMSYVRRDIDLKIRNSSANLRRSEAAIKRDIANAAPGYMSELYHRELKECENLFNITI